MKKSALKIAIAAAAFASAGAMAATDGTLGLTSTGTINVNINKGDLVLITGLTDILLGNYGALGADVTGSSTACVFTTLGGYNVTATSLNGVGNFAMSDGGGSLLPYTVDLNAVALTNAANQTGFLGNMVDPACGGGTNATVAVTVAAVDFNNPAVLAGLYNDTLTLVLAPE